MSASETAVPAAGSHPYPSELPGDFYPDLAQMYAAMAEHEKAALDKWEIAVRAHVLGSRGRHAVVAAVHAPAVPVPASVTVPGPPGPLPLPVAAAPLRAHRPSWFAKHGRHAHGPKRDQPSERTESVWQPPESRSGTIPPPVAEQQDADTLLPGAIEPVPALDPEQAGRLARFNDAHDQQDAAEEGTPQMTAVLPVPDQGDLK